MVFILLLVPSTPSLAQPADAFSYVITVDEDGDAEVSIAINAKLLRGMGIGETWLAVPRGERIVWSFTDGRPSYVVSPLYVAPGEINMFYNNITISTLGYDTISLRYSFKMASLIVDDRALFLSPLIVIDNRLSGKLVIHIKNVAKVNEYGVQPQQFSKAKDSVTVVFNLPLSSGRVWIDYNLEKPLGFDEIVIDGFRGVVPEKYSAYMRHILMLYSDLSRNMTELFKVMPENITVRFFLPRTFYEGVDGYVPILPSGLGDININIFTIRMLPGIMEHVAVHELIHHYLWSAGIDNDLLWFHEGAANFFSIYFLNKIGLRGVKAVEDSLLNVSQNLPYPAGFIVGWSRSSPTHNPTLYYASSYLVFHTLYKKHGLNLFEGFFAYLNENNVRIRETQDVVSIFSILSGGATDNTFRRLGLFADDSTLARDFRDSQFLLFLVFSLAVLLIISVSALTKLRRPNETYVESGDFPSYVG
ncbi:MAG: hypothetical protein NXY59_07655 [Aigarchaeota archaeon]|nr:hypothetical protein [Candidatus Pelearchaeum maunauluense]